MTVAQVHIQTCHTIFFGPNKHKTSANNFYYWRMVIIWTIANQLYIYLGLMVLKLQLHVVTKK